MVMMFFTDLPTSLMRKRSRIYAGNESGGKEKNREKAGKEKERGRRRMQDEWRLASISKLIIMTSWNEMK